MADLVGVDVATDDAESVGGDVVCDADDGEHVAAEDARPLLARLLVHHDRGLSLRDRVLAKHTRPCMPRDSVMG